MGARGPHPRSNHLKALDGVREDTINRDEPIPGDGDIVCPADVRGEARRVWESLAPDLIDKRVLRAWDVEAFAAYCRMAALFKEAAAEVEAGPLMIPGSHHGTVQNPAIRVMQSALEGMIKMGGRFGLTPSDRAGLKISDDGGARSGAARLLG